MVELEAIDIVERPCMVTVEQARLRLGWRREDLASKANVGLSTIVRVETGQRAPRYPVRLAIATALGVTVEAIDWPEKQEKKEELTNDE